MSAWGLPFYPVALPPEVAKKMELAALEANVVQLTQHLQFLRERIRELVGYDPASEAGLP